MFFLIRFIVGPMEKQNVKLERALGLASTFFVVTGSVIGSGVFLVATDIANAVPGPYWGLSTWIVAGTISFLGGLIFAELGTRFPNAGGQYVYLKEAFHPLLGFLFGWTLILVVQAGSIAAVAIAFARFFASGVSFPVHSQWLASVAVVLLTSLNCLGIKKGVGFLDGITAIKILAIIALALCGLFFSGAGGADLASTGFPRASSYGVALIAAFWAFDGWNNLGFVAGEVKNPRRNIPLGLGFGIVAITVLYLFANLTYFKFLTMDQIAGSQFVAADAARQILGENGTALAALFVSLSALGCTNGLILSGARVIYAMAKDRKLPALFAELNPKTHSPNKALIGQMVWSLILVWSGSYDQLFTYVVFAAFIFYGLSGLAIFPLRKKNPSPGADVYLVPGYPVLPAVYAVFTLAFTINALIEKPLESLAGLALVLLGVPAYWYYEKKAKAFHSDEKAS